MLHKCRQLFSRWNEIVSYCHWKSNEHLQEGLDGDTDLDVLLRKEDRDAGIAVLKETGFRQFRSQYGSRYPDVEDWIGLDEATGRLIHLHLHYSLMTGHTGLKEYRLPWTEESLELRLQDAETGVYIMNPNMELISLYTRLVLKARHRYIVAARLGKYRMNKHFTREIDYIKQRVDWNEVRCIADKYYGQDAAEFIHLLQSSELTSKQFLRLRSIVGRAMKPCCRYHGVGLVARRWYFLGILRYRGFMRHRYGKKLITRKVANPQKGISIAFVGQDGAGKSTVTRDIKKWLTWKIDAETFYLGSGDDFTPWTKRIQNYYHKRNKPMPIFLSWIPFAYLLAVAKHTSRQICMAGKYVSEGGIALFDRYPQTTFPGINDGPKIEAKLLPRIHNHWLRKISEWFAKREWKYIADAEAHSPDIVFKLLLSPEESMRRKPFENSEEVKRKHEIIKQLQFVNSKIYEIDCEQDYDQEIIGIKNIIWNLLP